MIENINLETKTITIKGEQYNYTRDLEFVGSYSGPQKPYLRKHTKVAIYKEIMQGHPEVYSEIEWRGWFQPYKNEIVGVATSTPENETKEENREGSVFNMDMNVIEKLTKAIEGISDKNRIEFAQDRIEEFSKEFITNFVKETYGALPTRITITNKDVNYDKTGLFHRIFPDVLKLVNIGIPVYIEGPAGTGKNYMVEQICDALNLKFFYASSIKDEFKLLGYKDANGEYQETEFYRWATSQDGGLFMLDEMDASTPEALVIINAALANGYVDFPVGRVVLNKDCRVIAAGNTSGLGADIQYTGRNVIDGATLDRFVNVKMEYDKRIEENLCQDKELRDFLYDIRKSVQDNHINHIVGMRSMKYSYQMLVNEFDKKFIIESAILKGLGKDDINVIKGSLNKDNEWYKFI